MTMVVLLVFVPILVAILLALNVLLAVHRPDAEKITAYECGFSPVYGQVRAPFAIQYYLVGLLFLIFDLEIAVLFPLGVTLYQVDTYGFRIAILFLILLTLGFVYEFKKGALKFTDHRSSIDRNPIVMPTQSPLIEPKVIGVKPRPKSAA
jgi:NADH:ubiquinone oxidoreductase subunit 3 (subunit A)